MCVPALALEASAMQDTSKTPTPTPYPIQDTLQPYTVRFRIRFVCSNNVM